MRPLIRLTRMKADLRGVETQLKRIADCLEAVLAAQGILVESNAAASEAKADEHNESEVLYTDEERDFLRDAAESAGVKLREPKDG